MKIKIRNFKEKDMSTLTNKIDEFTKDLSTVESVKIKNHGIYKTGVVKYGVKDETN